MPTFLHAADLHLDAPFGGLERQANAPVDRLRHASRRALERLVTRALERKVSFAVLAGGLYDAQPAFESWRFLRGQLQRLTDASIPVAVVLGPHDLSGLAPRAAQLPKLVRLLSTESWELVPGVVVHGRSQPQREVAEELPQSFPPPVAGKLNVGLLHTALAGHEDAPAGTACSLAALAGHGYAYWALGHLHRHLALVEAGVHVVFPGNLQGRHLRESGPRGAVFVDYEGPHIRAVTHEAFDEVRWEHLVIEASSLPEPGDPVAVLHARILGATRAVRAEGRLAAVGVTLRGEAARSVVEPGERALRDALLVRLEEEEGLLLAQVEARVWPTRPARSEAERQLAELIEGLARDEEQRAALGRCVDKVRRRLSEGDLALVDAAAFPGRRGVPPTEGEATAVFESALGLVRELLQGHGSAR